MSTDDYAFNTKLVEAVKKRTWLYDYTMKEHSNRDLIQATWGKVAEEVDSTARTCKEIWRSLRNKYNRCLKKPGSVSEATKKQCFLLHSMGFLKRYMGSKKMVRKKLSSTLQNKKRSAPSKPTSSKDKNQNKAHSSNAVRITVKSMNSMVNKTPQDSSTEPSPKKNNAQNTSTSAESSESKTEDRDSIKQQFLLSLLPDLQEMDANKFRLFRLQACDLINSILVSQQTIPKSSDKVLSLAEPQQKPQIFGEVSSMTRPLVSPQPISQSNNEVSSISSPSIILQQQSDSCIIISDDDEEIITRAANCKVEVSF